jgi:ankyrin repeat protein
VGGDRASGWRAWAILFNSCGAALFFQGSAAGQLVSGDDGFDHLECVILVTDPFADKVNAKASHESTFPRFVSSRRAKEAAENLSRPMPLGVIQFHGGEEVDLEVLIELGKNSRFLGHWPKSRSKAKRLFWKSIETKSNGNEPRSVKDDHWFTTLRTDSSLSIVAGDATERFIVYDAELAYKSGVSIESIDDDKVNIVKQDEDSALDLFVYAPAENGWKTAQIEELEQTKESSTASSLLSFSTSARSADDILAVWRSRLAGLSDGQIDFVIDVLKEYALDPEFTSLVYRLDRSVLDELIQVDVVPNPRNTVRIGLVVVRRAGPEFHENVANLILQLGDPEWAKREAAHKTLAAKGKSIVPLLKKAAKQRDLEIVYRVERLLATHGENGVHKTESLVYAAYEGNKQQIKSLLAGGADPDSTTSIGETALIRAARKGHTEIADILLEHGADMDAEDKYGNTALRRTAKSQDKKMADHLIAKDAKHDLFTAACFGLRDVADELLKEDPDSLNKQYSGWAPLHGAASMGRLEMIDFLLEKGASIEQPDFGDWTPLHRAVTEKGHESVKKLLERGANVNAKTKEGKTALDMAKEKELNKVVAVIKEYLEKKANNEGE